ncbi:MAG: response regulator transcription factor [Phycisphaerae bacterium]|nr:response regulator transcription factor [Phycisphaerae bacterium]
MILYMAADLLWATKIKCHAEALDVTARPARDLDTLKARLHDSDPRALLVDLDEPETALELIRHLRDDRNNERHMKIRVVAWGPHVEKDLLQRALDAGADEVLTRGSLEHHLDEVLLSLVGRSSGHHAQSLGRGAGHAEGGPTIL